MTHYLQAWRSETVHITDGGSKSRCGRTIESNCLGNDMSLDILGSGLRECPRCGTHEQFEQVRHEINAARKAAEDARKVQMAEIRKRQEKRAEIREQITPAIEKSLTELGASLTFDQFPMATTGKGKLTANGEIFDIKISFGSFAV